MININFISYLPGSKGKIIAELADMLVGNSVKVRGVDDPYGHTNWKIRLKLQQYNDSVTETFDTQKFGYIAEYMSSEHFVSKVMHLVEWGRQEKIIRTDKLVNIDTHYHSASFFDAVIENNLRAILIQVDASNWDELFANWIYKNLIIGSGSEQEKQASVHRLTDVLKTKRYLTLEQRQLIRRFEYGDYKSFPKELWKIIQLISTDALKHSEELAKNEKYKSSDSMLIINYNDIEKESTVMQIAEHVGIDIVPTGVFDRFRTYLHSQNTPLLDDVLEMIKK